MRLIAHLFCTALVFAFLVSLTWLLGVFLGYLHATQPFEASIHRLITMSKLIMLWLDIALSGVVLFVGIVRYIRELLEVA